MNLKADTPEAQAFWAIVKKVAEGAPAWTREAINKAAEESAREIIRREEENGR